MPYYKINQFKVSLDKKDQVWERFAKLIRVPLNEITQEKITRLSLDCRKGFTPAWTYNLEFFHPKSLRAPGLIQIENNFQESQLNNGKLYLSKKIIIAGAGPCGMSAAYHLAKKGYQVEVLEQGRPVESRFKDIRHFLKQGKLDIHSNVLYGEGGAGAFSDGKLTSRTRNEFTQQVLADWVAAGADPSIQYFSKPHIGTDRLQFIVRNLREMAIAEGAQFRFESVLEDIATSGKKLTQIKVNGIWEDCETLLVATGHSARDIYKMLHDHGILMEHKGFAVGFRVEHPQTLINHRQYGENTDIKLTGTAEYSLHCDSTAEADGGYSFCMCPGGVLIPCASQEGAVATNGMSYSRRNTPYANSGLVVPLDFSDQPIFAGLEFQYKLEKMAFEIGGKDYSAPAQKLVDFVEGRTSKEIPKSSWPRNLVSFDHNHFFEGRLLESLKKTVENFNKKIPGFIDTGILVSPETRTSAPIRVFRDSETLESNIQGLFPLGEGAGFAGGIVSSAADGVRFASLALNLKFKNQPQELA